MNHPEPIESPNNTADTFDAKLIEEMAAYQKETVTHPYTIWARQHLVSLIGGFVALLALLSSISDIQINREQQQTRYIAERYTKVVDILWGATVDGEPKANVRIREAAFLELLTTDWPTKTLDYSGIQLGNIDFAAQRNARINKGLTTGVFSDANLSRAQLYGANLKGAKFYAVNLTHANLVNANLQGAILINADLRGAVMRKTNLKRANLRGANLNGAHLIFAINLSCGQIEEAKSWDGANFDKVFLEDCPIVKAGL